MKTGIRFGVVLSVVLILTGEVRSDVTIRCQANNDMPDGHEVIRFDCTLETNAALSLNRYKVSLPCTGALGGGATGTLTHLTIPATTCTFAGPDPVCLFNGYQADCTSTQICFFPADCSPGVNCVPDPNNPNVSYCQNEGVCADPSPFIDTSRPNYVFQGQAGVTTDANKGNCPSPRPYASAAKTAGTSVSLDAASGAKYVGSFRYRVSDCATGSFTVVLQGNGNPPMLTDASYAVNVSNAPILMIGVGASVTVDTGQCCNVFNCLGNYNSYCCLNVQGGNSSDLNKTCLGGTPDPCLCQTDAQCNDNSVCTDDSCEPGDPQADANGCLNAENFPPGNCCNPTTGALVPINDGNPCTEDYCLNGTWPVVHDGPAANGNVCPDDLNVCRFDYCQNGVCTHPPHAYGTPCSPDGVYCTWDVCNGNGTCTHVNVNTISCTQVSQCPSSASSCNGSTCVCTGPPACFGDIAPHPQRDGICDLTDLLCCLDGYNVMSLCPQADIQPCGGDMQVELADLIGVLDGYAGIPACGLPACAGAP